MAIVRITPWLSHIWKSNLWCNDNVVVKKYLGLIRWVMWYATPTFAYSFLYIKIYYLGGHV